MGLVVQKFGGSSVPSAEQIRSVAELIAATVRDGNEVVVTVSAMGDETDELLWLAPAVADRQSPRELDKLISAGERKSAALLCLALEDLGVHAVSLTGSQAGIVTDEEHTDANIVEVDATRVREVLGAGGVPVVGGAQGATPSGEDTFLGRGGTDTTAVGLAAALEAEKCELWTDVEGVFSADPRVVPEAVLLDQITYEQMLEMCRAGCPKPTADAVALAAKLGIDLSIRSTFSRAAGTLVTGSSAGDPEVTAIVAGPADAASGQGPVSLVGPRVIDHIEATRLARQALHGVGIAAGIEAVSPLRLRCLTPGPEVAAAARALHAAFNPGLLRGDDDQAMASVAK